MEKKFVLVAVVVVLAVVTGSSIWIYVNHLDYVSKIRHETDRWAVITDSKGDIIAVETTSDTVWSQLVELHQNQTQMWIGGFVEEYDNTWGFRFDPDTIIVAEVTVEGAQSDIRGISGDLNYWMNVWAREAYVLANVVETHE